MVELNLSLVIDSLCCFSGPGTELTGISLTNTPTTHKHFIQPQTATLNWEQLESVSKVATETDSLYVSLPWQCNKVSVLQN